MKKQINKEKGVIYRTKDLHILGINNYLISQMIDQGQLIKLCHGIYATDDIAQMKITDINILVENGVISLLSAAMYYELYNGEVKNATITIDRDQKPPRLPYDIFVYIYTSSELFNIGLNVIDCEGREIKIYDLERTICDILKHRSKYDPKIVSQIVANYLKRDDRDLDKLIEYSKKLRIYNVVRQYIEILGVYDEQ